MSLDAALKNYEYWRDELDRDGASWYWKKHSFGEDSEVLVERLENFRSTDKKPLSDTLDDYRSKMSMQEMYEELCLQVDEFLIEELSENSIGNPPSEKVVTRSGKELLATFNDLILISFANKIFDALSTKQRTSDLFVLEIGGGYGGLAAKLRKLLPLSHITIIDLPHAGLLQTYYLGQQFPSARLNVMNYKRSNHIQSDHSTLTDFTIVPSTEIDLLNRQKFDLVINSRSFMEMDQGTISRYFALIQTQLKVDGLFFNCNRLWKNAGDRPTQIARYPYDDKWHLVSLSTSFFQNNTIELLARRTDKSNPIFKSLIRRLPKTDYLIHREKFQGIVEWLRPYVPKAFTVTYWKRVRKFKK
jgi:putative sugar O-methyltransferase